MRIRNTPEHFGIITKTLHWLIAVLIIGLIGLGWWMVDLSYYDRWYNTSLHWHKSLGMLVLGLALVKIAWQLYTPVPGPAGLKKPVICTAATVVHIILLLGMVLIPVTGYLISSSDGKVVEVFDWFAVPSVVSGREGLRDMAINMHFWLSYCLAALVIGHIGAAFKHQFIDRDGTLSRMLWK